MKKSLRILPVMLIIFTLTVFSPACFANSFLIEQDAGNSGGLVQRYISISSPWSGAYLHEELTVVGSAEIIDSFRMNNLGAGTEDIFESAAEDTFESGATDNHSPGVTVSPGYDVEDILAFDTWSIPTWWDLF